MMERAFSLFTPFYRGGETGGAGQAKDAWAPDHGPEQSEEIAALRAEIEALRRQLEAAKAQADSTATKAKA
jgi:hypothetical protein